MNVKQYAFVTAYLKHRDPIVAYKLATGSQSTNLRSLQSAANRMLNKPGVREEIESVLKATRAEVEAEIAETTRTELLTIERKREVLAQIVNGQYTVMVRTKGKNCTPCTYFNSPTIREVLTAIKEDNKMAGHYPVVTTTRRNLQHITTTSSEEKVPCPGDLGVILAFTPTEGRGPDTSLPAEARAKEGEMQQITTTSPEEIPSWEGRAVALAHKRGGFLASDTREMQQSATETCPPQTGVPRSDGGACLPHRQGTPEPDIPLSAEASAKEGKMQQITTTSPEEIPSWEGRAVALARKRGGFLASDTREMQQSATPDPNPSAAEAPAKVAAPDNHKLQQLSAAFQ